MNIHKRIPNGLFGIACAMVDSADDMEVYEFKQNGNHYMIGAVKHVFHDGTECLLYIKRDKTIWFNTTWLPWKTLYDFTCDRGETTKILNSTKGKKETYAGDKHFHGPCNWESHKVTIREFLNKYFPGVNQREMGLF